MADDDAPATKADLRRLEAKLDARDVTLFGHDGRGGLVADVNAAKQRSKAALWIVTAVGAPIVAGAGVGFLLWAVQRLLGH